MKGTLQITFSLFVVLNMALQYVCELLMIQKLCRQVSTLMGFTAVLRNVKHSTLFPS